MPPPNVTGQLHMGHAMDATLQDYAHPVQADAGLQCSVGARCGPCGDRHPNQGGRRTAEGGTDPV
ncbi:MAG: class I tRNA ligase family protein [Oscillospiraceae bacterium]